MQFAVSRLNVSEGSGFANISVNKVGRTAIPVTMQFATQDGSAVGKGREEMEGEEREGGREGGREEREEREEGGRREGGRREGGRRGREGGREGGEGGGRLMPFF